MALKRLKPTLPKDEAEILAKGFNGNIADSKRFITDGHSLLLVEKVVKGWEIKRAVYDFKPVKDAAMDQCWNASVNRKNEKAEFIGVGVVGIDSDDEPIVVAVIRKRDAGIVVVNPYKLKFCATMIGAEEITVASDVFGWAEKPINILRDGQVVGIVMPMRYSAADLSNYDLKGPTIQLKDV